MRRTKLFSALILLTVMALSLSACAPVQLAVRVADGARSALLDSLQGSGEPDADEIQITPAPADAPIAAAPLVVSNWGALQETLQQIYEKVNPSVVNIQVLSQLTSTNGIPFGLPEDGEGQPAPVQEGQGSGFVWDKNGNIVTNNHVIAGADQVRVVFSDGLSVAGTVVGVDVNSDLAVVHVDVSPEHLTPVQMADSDTLKVGQLAVAIGNPFGLAGTQTVGFISALGRSLAVSNGLTGGASYSIPDVVQTDAPINPGNSGGVLVNDLGQVVGVTTAIESPVRASAGIGYAVPSAIVQRVVPVLIEQGSYRYPWLGISGGTLTAEVAQAMGLAADQRGLLVGSVTPGGPADVAGLIGSEREVEINGFPASLGGDVIVAIDGEPVVVFEDLVSYLAKRTEVGQTIELTVLRNGQQEQVSATLGERPDSP